MTEVNKTANVIKQIPLSKFSGLYEQEKRKKPKTQKDKVAIIINLRNDW